MVAKCLILLVILKIGAADPDPDPGIVVHQSSISQFIQRESKGSGTQLGSNFSCCNQVLKYRYTSDYELIWNSNGTNGIDEVSIWRAKHKPGYCSIGDVVTIGYDQPKTRAVLLASIDTNALVKPTGFNKIWADHGSGAPLDVRVYEMIAPAGYRCLGNAAVDSYSGPPPKMDLYCCVKEEYTVLGATQKTYTSAGSGAIQNASLWTVVEGAVASGIEAGNFVTVIGFKKPPFPVFLLEVDGVFFQYPPGSCGQCFKYFADKRRTHPAAKSKCQSENVGGTNLELAHPFNPIGLRQYMMDRFGDAAKDGKMNTCWLDAIRKPLYYEWPDNSAILSFNNPLWYSNPTITSWKCMRLLMQVLWLNARPQSPYDSYPCSAAMYTLCELK